MEQDWYTNGNKAVFPSQSEWILLFLIELMSWISYKLTDYNKLPWWTEQKVQRIKGSKATLLIPSGKFCFQQISYYIHIYGI